MNGEPVARILVVTKAGDHHAQRVAERLRQRGADVALLELGGFPSEVALSAEMSADGTARRVLRTGGRGINLDCLDSVWFRRAPLISLPRELTDPTTRRYVEREAAAFSADVWDTLGCRAVPAAGSVMQAAAGKIRQLVEAGRVGFEMPPTLITTDPEAFLDFYCAHNGKVITKAIEQLWAHARNDDFFRYTQHLSTRDIGSAAAVRLCPIIVQPYVKKALELRVTVVGRQVFAAAIDSQESNHARLDWRCHDRRTSPFRAYRLAETLATRCADLVEGLGLSYGAIDLIHTPDGRDVFLEINPDGEYAGLEDATGLPISEAICDLLLASERGADHLAVPAGVA